MVTVAPGFYFCHAFDLGSRPPPFRQWTTRVSLPVAPSALRYCKVVLGTAQVFVNELGFAVAFQPVPAQSRAELDHLYEHHFDAHYEFFLALIRSHFGTGVIGEASFQVVAGSSTHSVSWRTVELPAPGVGLAILVEAVLIDELCRALERRGDTFARESSLADDRLLVEYAECLFALATPAGFLVEQTEIAQMDVFFASWKLYARVTSLRTRFTESVANTTLYRGHLERNRQGMLNAILTGIALLSLAQVSGPISAVLAKLAIVRTESQLNQVFVVIAVIIMLLGSWRYAIKPTVGIWFDNFKRWRVGRRTQQ
jgi:hypothetical protein